MHLDTITNKTILLQTSNHPTPHLEAELEIMQRLLEQGNTIHWIICNRNFETCFHNPEHKLMHCKVCHSRVMNGADVLKESVQSHKNLHILNYEQFMSLDEFKAKTGFQADFNFETIQELKANQYKSYDNGMATMSSLVSYTKDHLPDLKQYKKFIDRGLTTGAYLYDLFHLVLDEIKPDLVILFNGRFVENRPLLRVCEHRNIDYATHERGGKMKNFLFRVNSIPHSFEAIAKEIQTLWNRNDPNREAIGKHFFNKRVKRIEDAWYSFTKDQKYGQLPESFKHNEGKKIITIFNSSLNEYEGLSGFGPKFYENDNEGILKICEDMKAFPNIKLYLRVHPNLKGIDNAQNRFINEKLKASNIEVIGPEDSVDSYELVDKSDIIIVFTSTVGVEAAFENKKVMLLGRAAYESLDCAIIPKSHEEVMRILTDEHYDFPKVNPEDPIKFGYWFESYGIDYKYYQPTGIAKGKYNGKTIKANFFYRRLKRFVKWFN